LKPLEQEAACQTFIDIADNWHNPEEIDKVLSLTDNMPLALNLFGHSVYLEGCENVLSHWEEEKSSLISDGHDKRSNLDLSISLFVFKSENQICLPFTGALEPLVNAP
jgi:hypothetical protein